VLKRYVNFMNKPDERTAVDQFGKGDKYFGVCALMATLPGLPMFGHGQIEGFTERYGMEYRKAYNPETPDQWLVARHEREISPLLHRRALFAEVREFLLYDFYTEQGHVNEDVFAYSNRLGEERALVIYNNRYAETRGWVRMSCAYAQKAPDGGKHLRQRTLGEALGLAHDPAMFLACRDTLGGLEYLHRASHVAERGMYVELGAYKHHVFLDWRDLREDEGHPWGALCEMLGGRGVSSLDDALRDLRLKPVHDALRELLDVEIVGLLAGLPSHVGLPDAAVTKLEVRPDKLRTLPKQKGPEEAGLQPIADRVHRLLDAVQELTASEGYRDLRVLRSTDVPREIDSVVEEFTRVLEAARRIPQLERLFSKPWPEEAHDVLPSAEPMRDDRTPAEATSASAGSPAAAIWGTVLAWAALRAVGLLLRPGAVERGAAVAFDQLRLREPMAEVFRELGWTGEERWQAAARVRATFAHASFADGAQRAPSAASGTFSWLHDPDVAWLIGVHRYEDEQYFVKEPFERFLWWMALPSLLRLAEAPAADREAAGSLERHMERCLRAAAEAGYRVEALLGM
jgi:hypothetical protein